MEQASSSSFWQSIDGICVINLDHRNDRWESIHTQLLQLGVPDEKIHRISAVWGKTLPGYKKGRLFRNCTEDEALFWAGRAGCELSHGKCIQYIADHGWQKALILEDDAVFVHNLDGTVGKMLSDVANRSDEWDLFFLGMTPYYSKAEKCVASESPKGEVTVARIMGPLCAHCYLVSANACKKILPFIPQEKNVWRWLAFHLSYDSWIANEIGRSRSYTMYGCYPNLCVQGEFYSDIEHVRICHNLGAYGGTPHPVTYISGKEFRSIFRSPSFLCKKYMKILAHYMLGIYYYAVGYKKFSVSIENAGYFGALKAALGVLKKRTENKSNQ